MKTAKIIIMTFIFICILGMNSSVFATSYGALNCNTNNGGVSRWSLKNQCSEATSTYSSTEMDLLKFDVDSNGRVIIVMDVDRSLSSDKELSIEDGIARLGTNKFNYKRIQEYYDVMKKLPSYIIVVNDGLFSFTYYPSPLLPISSDDKIVGYYAETSILSTATVGACVDYDYYIKAISQNISSNKSYSNQVNELKSVCKKWKSKANYDNSECYKKCLNVEEDLKNVLSGLSGDDDIVETNECGLGKNMVAWLIRILKILRYIVPAIVVVLSTLEYIGAISASDDDSLKKVGARFSKRLFIMILIFLLPSIMQFIFDVFNIQGLDTSNPYCLKFK